MTASMTPTAYRFDSDELHMELTQASLVRTVASNNIRQDLDFLTDDKYRYEKELLDSNPQVSFGEASGSKRRADISIEYVDVNVPRIEEGVAYKRADIAKINKGRMPISDRVRRVLSKMGESEERFFFAGDPKVGDGMGHYELTDALNSTAWGATAFDVTTIALARSTLGAAIGQLIDTYKSSLKQFPLFLAVSPDIYKLLINQANVQTDASTMGLLTNDLKMHGANTALPSHIFMSKYLFGTAGALGLDGPDVVLKTEGVRAAALICGDPDSWRVETSMVDQNDWMVGGNLRVDLGYSFVPYYKNNDAIIYEAGVVV